MQHPRHFPSASSDWPTLSHTERDRRWGLAQGLIDSEGLDALLVYGERDTVGQPLYAPDAWLTNDRPGNAVLVPAGEDPYVLVQLHIAVGQHMEAVRRGDSTWIPPERMYAGPRGQSPGAGRGSPAIAAFLQEKHLDSGRIGVVGLEPAGVSFPEGLIPHGTFANLRHRCPEADFIDVGSSWHQLVMARSEEELALVARAAEAGEAMCAAMIDATHVGAEEHEIYATAMEACFAAGGITHWLILVVARDGESVAWGPPAWTYRPQQPDLIREGDVVMAELFPTYGMLEAQQQLAIAVGDPHPDVLRAGEAAQVAYEAGLTALKAGATFADLNDAMNEPIRDAGGWTLTPHVHSLNPMMLVGGCGLSSELPEVDKYGTLGGFNTRGADTPIRPGFTFAFQPNCVIGRRRVNIGGTVALTDHGRLEFNTLPNQLHRV